MGRRCNMSMIPMGLNLQCAYPKKKFVPNAIKRTAPPRLGIIDGRSLLQDVPERFELQRTQAVYRCVLDL